MNVTPGQAPRALPLPGIRTSSAPSMHVIYLLQRMPEVTIDLLASLMELNPEELDESLTALEAAGAIRREGDLITLQR